MMNKQKKEAIMHQISKVLAARSMDLMQLYLMMGEKGYNDEKIKGFFGDTGLTLSQIEFNEVYEEVRNMIEDRKKIAEATNARREKEDEPKSFEQLQKTNLVTNDKDLLSQVRNSPEHTPFSTDTSPSFTVAATTDEPVAELVQLPSKGRFYEGVLKDKEGVILLRPITLKEEKIFSTERLMKTGQAFDMVFRNCIKTPGIDTTKLLSSDRVYLLFRLRAVSYGPDYEIKTICSNCKQENKTVININDLKITHPPKELFEPYPVTLPASQKVLYFKLSRGEDDSKSIKRQYLPQKVNDTNNLFLERVLNLIVDIDGVPKEKWESIILNLIGRDLAHIRKTMQLVDFGYVLEETISCAGCGSSLALELSVNETFFRT